MNGFSKTAESLLMMGQRAHSFPSSRGMSNSLNLIPSVQGLINYKYKPDFGLSYSWPFPQGVITASGPLIFTQDAVYHKHDKILEIETEEGFNFLSFYDVVYAINKDYFLRFEIVDQEVDIEDCNPNQYNIVSGVLFNGQSILLGAIDGKPSVFWSQVGGKTIDFSGTESGFFSPIYPKGVGCSLQQVFVGGEYNYILSPTSGKVFGVRNLDMPPVKYLASNGIVCLAIDIHGDLWNCSNDIVNLGMREIFKDVENIFLFKDFLYGGHILTSEKGNWFFKDDKIFTISGHTGNVFIDGEYYSLGLQNKNNEILAEVSNIGESRAGKKMLQQINIDYLTDSNNAFYGYGTWLNNKNTTLQKTSAVKISPEGFFSSPATGEYIGYGFSGELDTDSYFELKDIYVQFQYMDKMRKRSIPVGVFNAANQPGSQG